MPSALLAVQMRELVDGIALARNGVGRHRIRQRREILGCESEVQGAESFVEPIAPAGANQGNDIGALRRHPRDCDLCHRSADRVGSRPQAFDERQVGVQVRALKRGLMLRNVRSPARAFDRWPLISPRGSPEWSEAKSRQQEFAPRVPAKLLIRADLRHPHALARSTRSNSCPVTRDPTTPAPLSRPRVHGFAVHFVNAVQPLRQQMQVAVAAVHRLERMNS
jgi:hypothetical protein